MLRREQKKEITIYDWIQFNLGVQPNKGYELEVLVDLERDFNQIPPVFKDRMEYCVGFLKHMESSSSSPWQTQTHIYYGFKEMVPKKYLCGKNWRSLKHDIFSAWIQ
jgi:hypothetical protein